MNALPRILAIMGSGETAPTMVSTHRRLTSLLPRPVKAVVIDTPFGFQENAPELASRAVDYFKTSVVVDLSVAGLVRLHDTHIVADPVQVERGLRLLEDATYVFAGPGSPTYALRQWQGSRVAEILRHKITHGGIVVFASAAALTLGKYTVPVYEIYKVGQDVSRLDGLDILASLGINAVVIPHYNNAEGGHHDTRFCYLGETRLELFESMLDPETFVLGVDEHTGLVINIDDDTAQVVGNGTVTVRTRSRSRVFSTGETVPMSILRDPWSDSAPTQPVVATATRATESPQTQTSLGAMTLACRDAFSNAIAANDANRAVRAILDLEQALHDWSADTLQGTDGDDARATLRSMISRLGDLAVNGTQDPREIVAPLVNALLAVRTVVRAEKRFDLSDIIRDEFTKAGIEVRDTPDGPEWHLSGS